MFKYILIVSFIVNFAISSEFEVTLKWLRDKPRGVYKDFYIWRFLNQSNTSKQDAQKAFEMANNVSYKILDSYVKYIDNVEFKDTVSCLKADIKQLYRSGSTDCMATGLTPYKATLIEYDKLTSMIDKINKAYPNYLKGYDIISANIPFTKLVSSENEIFFEIFNKIGRKFRMKYFNHKIPKQTLDRISKDKHINRFIELVVPNRKYDKLNESLLEIDLQNSKLSHNGLFLLSINAILLQKEQLAIEILQKAYKKAYYRFDKDKVMFWQYLLTQDMKYLKKLSKSVDINIYSIYAKERVGVAIDNIKYDVDIKPSNTQNSFDTSNPFEWLKVLNDTKKVDEVKYQKYQNIFDSISTKPHLAFIAERFHKYKVSYFITPYEDILQGVDIDRKALIYAISRQESRFIPTSISYAFAMGPMQIMPFLSKSIARKLKEFYNIYDQLTPTANLRYADFHLNYLQKHLYHPLFIAYGYNGGIGFIKKAIKNGLFQTDSKYEPFISMEIIPYAQSRKYGKKVLANYYIYKNYLDKKDRISIDSLFKSIFDTIHKIK